VEPATLPLSAEQLRTLTSVCNSLVPKTEATGDPAFDALSASSVGVDAALAEIIDSKLEPSLRSQFHRLLAILDSRAYNLILSGGPVRFSELSDESKAKYLKSWRDSRLGTKRTAFQALKRLTCFLFYALPTDSGGNPTWPIIGYPGPELRNHLSHPAELKILPLVPTGDASYDCDVCVVGSGAGGSVLAYELGRSGANVIVMEAGGYETADGFDQKELNMMNRLFDEYGTAATKDLSFLLLAGRGAGGGTVVNWCTCLRPPDFVMREWERDFGIAGLTSPAFASKIDSVWSTLKVNVAESQRNPNNDALWRGCSSLGYKEGTDYEVIPRNAIGCQQRCSFCSYGCAYSCKQSTIINYLPMAFRNGVRFLFNTLAERILVRDGKAVGVEATCGAGPTATRVKVTAKIVVAACGAIKTPALLLRSSIREKGVGRNLRLHPTTDISGYFEAGVNAWKGPPQTVAVRKYLDLDSTGHGFWIEAAPAHPGLFALSIPWRDGADHKRFMKERFTRSTATIVLLREWGSGKVELDKHGSTQVSYELDQRDRSNFAVGLSQAGRILAAAGASELWTLHSEPVVAKAGGSSLTEGELDRFSDEIGKRGVEYNRMMLFSAHMMGTCRMSASPDAGPAKPTGELHHVENLFVGDASVFPTSLGANPMITIMAMASKTADEIVRKLSRS
jgi:choline dehydrogenase-like flavoprotein